MVSRPTINSKGYPVLANVIQLGSDLENTLIPLVTKIGFVVLGLAIIAAMITLTFQLVGYFQIERACKKHGIEKTSEQLEKTKAELHIKRKVKLVFLEDCKSPLSIGFFSPIIVVPFQAEEYDEEKLDFILRHELTHIRNLDLWVKLLGLLTMAVHCFNPLSYFLFFELCKMVEVHCDVLTTKNYTEEEKKRYGDFLLDLVTDSDAEIPKTASTVRLVSGGTKEMKERILEMEAKKKKRRMLPILLAVAIASIAWVAALAYDPAPIFEATPGLEPNPNAEIILGTLQDPYDLYGSNSGDTFVDDDGNIYTISETNRAFCLHNYVATTIAEHELHSDGSCTVTYYSVKRCTKCGNMKDKTYSNKATFEKCIH